jgi:beta-glucosidase
VSGHGKPVITVLVSGRPMYANDLLNLSDAFVAAWLPGTEGKGIADILFAAAPGAAHYDFHGSLPFAWPRMPCQASFDGSVEPLFGRGYGLTYAHSRRLAALETPSTAEGCAARSAAAPSYR